MMRNQRGVTLAELLVALLIFAMVASASVYSLRLGVEARDQFSDFERRLSQFQIARLVVKEDLAQLIDRPVRDEFGEPQASAFRGGLQARPPTPIEGETVLMSFVRSGWLNPEAEAPRSSLQYVEYVLKGGDLVRRSRSFLDDARGQPRHDRVLLENAGAVQATFLNGEAGGRLEWANEWPLPGGANRAPRAVTLAYASPRWGAIEMRYWIGDLGAQAQQP